MGDREDSLKMMRLAVFSHKPCWPSAASPSGYATDGGFPFQMSALAEIFNSTRVVVPSFPSRPEGETPLTGKGLSVAPLTPPRGTGLARKLALAPWLIRNLPVLVREVRRADAVHTPIPGDIGTIGMLLAMAFNKPLFVRHCGNWFVQNTAAERFWKWIMERFAGGTKVMLATGGADEPPSSRNRSIRWVFSTSLSERELDACFFERTPPVPERARLLIACRQDREKGTGVVIESLPLLLGEFSNLTLDVVGDGADLEEFKRTAALLEVDRYITFHGKVNHETVLNLMKRADVFCYPTTASEGFPKVVLEALACGLPVITTPVSVLRQLIAEGGGILIEEAKAEDLSEAVRRIISSPDLYESMSARAIETAGKYSLERWRDTIREQLQISWGHIRVGA